MEEVGRGEEEGKERGVPIGGTRLSVAGAVAG
jgi:hypothetical protein